MINQRKLATGLCMILLSGCRFGNYAEAPKPNAKEGYQSIELYFTQADQLITRAILDDAGNVTENNQAPLSAIPVSIRNTFTNPLYFAVPRNIELYPQFIGLNQSSFIETQINKTGEIDDVFRTRPSVLWNNENCLTQIEIAQSGTFDRTRTGTVTFGDGTSSPVSGHLNLHLSYLRVISGDCTADLQELANCYTNGAGCSTDQLNAASNLYDLHVRQTGVLNINDVARLRGLAYDVYFE